MGVSCYICIHAQLIASACVAAKYDISTNSVGRACAKISGIGYKTNAQMRYPQQYLSCLLEVPVLRGDTQDRSCGSVSVTGLTPVSYKPRSIPFGP